LEREWAEERRELGNGDTSGRTPQWPLRHYQARRIKATASFLFAVGVELLEVGPQFVLFLGIAHAGERHPRAGDLLHRVADIFLERRLVPGDPGILDLVRIVEAGEGPSVAAIEPVERRGLLGLWGPLPRLARARAPP